MAAGSSRQAGVALVVGVGKYRSAEKISPLRYASRDARAFARLLADPDVCGFPQDQIALLTDRGARRRPILEHLSTWLPERSRGADIAVIYFACHGMQQEIGGDEEGYLLPYDADPDRVVATGVAMAEVANLMNAVYARAVVVLLDCCYAGHVLTRDATITRSPSRDMSIKPAVLEKLLGRNRFLIVACDKDQKSIEPSDLKHGLFTYHLLNGMAGAADSDRDGRVGVYELSTYVSQAVARDAPKFGHVQTPWAKGEWKELVFLSSPRRQSEGQNTRNLALEQLWKELGPDRAMAHLERQLVDQGEPWFLSILSFVRRQKDTAAIPFLFHCLAHQIETIRDRAKRLVEEHSWEAITAASLKLARHIDAEQGPERIGFLLEGLGAIEANTKVIRLLDEFVMLLSGSLRGRAILMLERKQLSIDLEAVKPLFDAKQSPYRIEKVLGPGVFTAAYLAKHEFTGLPVVVRVLRPKFVDDHTVRLRFLEVGKQSYTYVHPGLVHTRDVQAISDSRIYYTVRDYIEGVTVQDVLAQGKRFEPLQILEILRQVFDSLTPIHTRDACHCGIKPSNLFLSHGERVRVILGDLSLPIPHFGPDRLSYDYRYAPPEMFGTVGSLCPQSDFYSIGCVGYELLCGSPPFKSDNVFDLVAKHVNEAIPPPSRNGSRLGIGGDHFFNRLLAKRPEDRFRSLSEATQALDALRDQLQPPVQASARPVTILGRDSLGHFDPLRSVVSLADIWAAVAPIAEPRAGQPTEDPATTFTGGAREASDSGDHFSVPHEGSDSLSDSFIAGPPPVIEEGRAVFEGKYRLIKKLGEGAMGQVWLVENLALNTESALKLLKLDSIQAEHARLRFKREAKLMRALKHPRAVAVYDFGSSSSIGYIEMEYVRGETLQQILEENQGGPMPLEWIVPILDQLCAVLQEAHGHVDAKSGKPKPIVHRDLKPSNLMLVDEKQDGQNLKVLDFGIAKIVDDEQMHDQNPQLTNLGEFVGTVGYCSPEQIRNGAKASDDDKGDEFDGRSDIYSVGVILYQLLTGRLPFRGNQMAVLSAHLMTPPEPLSKANPKAKIPPEIERLVLQCLEKDPARRPQTAQELADRFHAAAAHGTRRGWQDFLAYFTRRP